MAQRRRGGEALRLLNSTAMPQKLRKKALERSSEVQLERSNSGWNYNEFELDSIVDRCEPNASLLNRTILSGLKSARTASQLDMSSGWRQEARKEASRIYRAVGSALAARDEAALQELTTPSCFEDMQKSLNSRKRNHLVHWKVLQLTASAEQMRIGKQRRSAYASSAAVDCIASSSSAASASSASVIFAQLTCRINARVIWEVIDTSGGGRQRQRGGGRLWRCGVGSASAPHELSDTWVLERCISHGGEGLPRARWRLKAKLVEPSAPAKGLPAAGMPTDGAAAFTCMSSNHPAYTTASASWLRAERMLRGSALEAALDRGALLLVSSFLGAPDMQRGLRPSRSRAWRWLTHLTSTALLALTSKQRMTSKQRSGLDTTTANRRGASITGQPLKAASSYRRAAALKELVLERDGHKCAYCGALPRPSRLTIDHVLPRAEGGADEADNLVACCEPCNTAKASKLLGVLDTPFTTRMTPRFSAIDVMPEVLGVPETLMHIWRRLRRL